VVVLVEEKIVEGDHKIEYMDCFEERIHRVCRKLRYFLHYWGYMKGLMVNLYLVERLDASWVPVGVPPMVELYKHDITFGDGEEGNKMLLHTNVDIGFPHKGVVCGCKGCNVSYNQSTHTQCEKPQVCLGKMVGV
jgi:hypothetical protein